MNSNELSLKDALKNMVEYYRLNARLNQTKIQNAWASTMGTSIAKYTKEIKLRKNKLYITITAAPLRQELSFGKDKIKKILNEELGEHCIDEVIIR
ncbi:MAG: hypothetical protein DHS20C18_12660 [Saprospiraceae bacterium]|nr:MAG: hypothetical protein DHS20C18_12660 [Saprospiraceae bacterium]